MGSLIEPTTSPVRIIAADGAWVVRITEAGSTSDIAFQIESAARAYAEGQKIRLAVDHEKRPPMRACTFHATAGRIAETPW